MNFEENTYTMPTIYKGKKPVNIPKGSSLEKEWAKNIWYINYSFNGKQIRVKGDLNRIKCHIEKAKNAEILRRSISIDLENGYNPLKKKEYLEKLLQNEITVNQAVEKYLIDLAEYARPKTVQSYRSKLHYLTEDFDKKTIRSFTAKDIQDYIVRKIKNSEKARVLLNGKYHQTNKTIAWSPNTVRSAKGIFRAFFQWCINKNYYTEENPVSKIESKRIRSEVKTPPRNIPFTMEDNTKIMTYLDTNDRITAFFCRFIYYTCMRPGEISKLKISDIDIVNKRILIPLNVTKNTKSTDVEEVVIEDNLLNELKSLKLDHYPSNYFLISNNETIVGAKPLGKNIPYHRMKKALKNLGLENKGYNTYSFKHFSNIQRYNNGWKLPEIMKANRHSSIAMTEKYLKGINRDTDISNKTVPKI